MRTHIIILLVFTSLVSFSQGVINNGAKLILNGAVQVSIDGANGNYLSKNNGIITPSTGSILQVKGNWYNNSSNTGISADAGTVILNGAAQSIAGSNTTVFYNLKLQGNGTKTLNINTSAGGATIKTGNLDIATQVLDLNSYTLSINNPNNLAITNSTGYIVSETNLSINPSSIKWMIGTNSGSYIFPFGLSGSQIPFTFSVTSAMPLVTDFVSISTRQTITANNQPWAGISDAGLIGAVTDMNDINQVDISTSSIIDRWWDIYSSSPTVADLIFSYRGSENTTNYSTGTTSAQHWNGTSWDMPVGNGTNVTTGIGTCTVTNASTFSPWVLITNNINALPVELTKFEYSCQDINPIIKWSTISEINNSYFQLEKGKDGINYEMVAKITGSGYSTSLKQYAFEDKNFIQEKPYYRLKQVDLNGQYKYYPSIYLEQCKPTKTETMIYNNYGEIRIEFIENMQDNVLLGLYDVNGKNIYSETLALEAGLTQHFIDVRTLPAGIYFIRIEKPNNPVCVKKIVLSNYN